MGKKLIIKGADFSKCAVEAKVTDYTDFAPYISTMYMNLQTTYGYGIDSKDGALVGKPINRITIYPYDADGVKELCIRVLTVDESNNIINHSDITTFVINDSDIANKKKVVDFDEVVLMENQYLVVGNLDITSLSKICVGTSNGRVTNRKDVYGSSSTNKVNSIGINPAIDYSYIE